MASFGVGDTIAVIKICIKLANLIQECHGAPESYKVCVTTLESLYETFSVISLGLEQGRPDASNRACSGHFAAHAKLQDAVTSSKRALQKCATILQERYASLSPLGTVVSLARIRRRLLWPGTQKRYDEQLAEVFRAVNCINVVVGVRSMFSGARIEQSLAAIQLELNARPSAIGYPGTGGQPEEHIYFEDGLGTSTHFPTDLCSMPSKLEGFLPYRFAHLPGENRVRRGHFRLYCTSFNKPQLLVDANWSHLVVPGSKISLAFIIGTWQMGCLNWCPTCNTENRGTWKAWRQCSCGTTYYMTEADEVDYEPIDGHWFGESPRTLESWPVGDKPVEPVRFGPQVPVNHAPSASDGQPEEAEISEMTSRNKAFDEELYFRRMVLIYDPIFNYVVRNVFCRCVLGATSLSSQAPRIDLWSTVPCPRHAPKGARLSPHVLDTDEDFHVDDPYFDRYGGRSKFLQIARYINESTVARAFVDVDKLWPMGGGEQLAGPYAESNLWKKYRLQVLDKIKPIWLLHQRQRYLEVDQDFVAHVDEWFVLEREYLLQALPSSEEDTSPSRVHWGQITPALFATLSNGRCTMESPEDIMKSSDFEFTLV